MFSSGYPMTKKNWASKITFQFQGLSKCKYSRATFLQATYRVTAQLGQKGNLVSTAQCSKNWFWAQVSGSYFSNVFSDFPFKRSCCPYLSADLSQLFLLRYFNNAELQKKRDQVLHCFALNKGTYSNYPLPETEIPDNF